MSIISSRKSIASSILKSSASSRENSIRKSKQLRFYVENLGSVKHILKDVEENENSKGYQDLIYKLSHDEVTDENLIQLLSECIDCVQLFKKEYILFLDTLLSIRWIERDTKIIHLFHEFLLNLLTSRSEFLTLCLSKILLCFVPANNDNDNDNETKHWINGVPSKEMTAKLDMVHDLLRKLIEVIPMIPVTLKKKIRQNFPYFKQLNMKMAAYIHNILRILDYCPVITYDVFELIFENLLSIDVSITRAEIEEAEENEVDEDFDDDNIMKLPIAESLDVCMDIIFNYFHSKLSVESTTSGTQQKHIQDALFQYFNDHIIKTHNSKHVHFLFFYIASFRKSFLNELLNILQSKIVDRNKPPVIRQYAIGYLSSLLARAKFIPLKSLKSYLQQLCNFVHDYINSCNSVTYTMSPKAHAVFHAACQAIFYIIAFRHRDLDLVNSKNNVEFLISLNIQPIVKHPLNPLFYCLPAIATIFDSVMAKHQIIYCQTILFKNASRKLATVYTTNENHNPEDIIESVFPFDPYLLKKSGRKVEPIYIEYQGADDQEPSSSPTKAKKRERNESECCDDIIIPVKQSRMC